VGERLVVSGLASSGEATVAFTGEAGDQMLRERSASNLVQEILSNGDPLGVLLDSYQPGAEVRREL
jgi:hypothetical protein